MRSRLVVEDRVDGVDRRIQIQIGRLFDFDFDFRYADFDFDSYPKAPIEIQAG